MHGFQREARHGQRRARLAHKRAEPVRVAPLAHHVQACRSLRLGAPVGVEVRLQAVEERLELGRRAREVHRRHHRQLIASVQHLAHAQHVVRDDAVQLVAPQGVRTRLAPRARGDAHVRQRNKLHIVVGAGFLESEAHGLRDARAAPSRPRGTADDESLHKRHAPLFFCQAVAGRSSSSRALSISRARNSSRWAPGARPQASASRSAVNST